MGRRATRVIRSNAMPAELPPDLAAKVDAFLQENPRFRDLVDILRKKHAEGTPEQAAQARQSLDELMQPSTGSFWKWVFGGIVLLVVGSNAWDYYVARQHAAALARSTPAVAQIKRMEPRECDEPDEKRCVVLELEVHREGTAPYTASLSQVLAIEWMSRVQPGAWLTVGVQPDDPSVVLFDEASLQVAAPAPPKPANR